ncbi:trehalose synthase [Xanthomonas sp. AmX2]|uniref:alpha-amylase family glycosyl hydrolase n=1 Tax=Xanthomonas sp. TaxID=29446 RepID=UPI00197FA8FD|nr:alpha-amylase family glycosyl hydrolase [Xanthomonas sp.]MBN6150192.1 trehalose synthase [Xanthomonas sp.]
MQPNITAIYQIDPYLFRDSDGHGWGTLDGIASKLDYLESLGISHIWLLPFFRSGGRDGGYDVIDHCRIDPRLGDEAAFDRLVRAARERGIELIVELVMQHTSDLHPWFQGARRGDAALARHYVWAEAPPARSPGPMFPPMEPTIWTWEGDVRRYYRHMFYAHEPDLDLGHAPVRSEMARVMRFWLERGVCGFRVDAAPYMVERARCANPQDDGLWLFEEMRRTASAYRSKPVLIGEADVKASDYGTYLGAGTRLSHLLDFHLNNHFFLALARADAGEITRTLAEYGSGAPSGTRIAWLRNHDELDLEQLEPHEREEVMERFAPRADMRLYGRGIRRRLAPMLDADPDALAMAHAVLLSLGQVPVLRYGDEIGLGEDLALPERNAVRVPMQWHGGAGAGFTDCPERAWRQPLRDGPFGYARINVAMQERGRSLLNRVRQMLHARRSLPQFCGEPEALELGPSHVLALRFAGNERHLLALVNLSASPTSVDIGAPAAAIEVPMADRIELDGSQLRMRGYGYAWLCVPA